MSIFDIVLLLHHFKVLSVPGLLCGLIRVHLPHTHTQTHTHTHTHTDSHAHTRHANADLLNGCVLVGGEPSEDKGFTVLMAALFSAVEKLWEKENNRKLIMLLRESRFDGIVI